MAKKDKPAPEPSPEEIAGVTGPTGEPGPFGHPGPMGLAGPSNEGGPNGIPVDTITVEVPQEVIDALGGQPIPAPTFRAPRPTVTRVGTKVPGRPDPGGLLATPRPERRAALAKIDSARTALSAFVRQTEGALPDLAAKIAAAATDPDACEAEGYDVTRANALIEDLHALLAKHLG